MTKFEQIGVERQLESNSKSEAMRCFKFSCKVCCYRGMRIDCDKCAIAHTHNEVIACFDDYENAKSKKVNANI